jgi:hypothetical protein
MLISAFCLLGAIRAPGALELRLDEAVELQRAGIRFTPFREIPLLPKPSPDTFTFTDPRTDQRIEALQFSQAWKLDQTRALFTNDIGRVTVAMMSVPNRLDVEEINDGYVTESAYRAAAEGWEPAWTEESIAAWIEAFSGSVVSGHRQLGKKYALPFPCRMYSFHASGYNRAFLMKVSSKTARWFVVFQFEIRHPESIENLDLAVLRWLRSVSTSTTRTSSKTANMRHQNFSALAQDANQTETFLHTKRRVIDNINALDDWWYVEMPHYVLVSNLKKSNKGLVDRIQKDIEILRSAFEQIYPPIKPIEEVSVIRVFNSREEYLTYVGAEYAWTIGLWMPNRKELVVSPTGSGGSGGKKEILDTAYHEAFHQYVFYALDQAAIPMWLNEGLACLFEAARFSTAKKFITIDENEGRLAYMEHYRQYGDSVDVIDMMFLSRRDFYVVDEFLGEEYAMRQRGLHYATAWAFAYFLEKGAPAVHPGEKYSSICDRIVEYLLENPNDFDGAADFALEGIDRKALRRDFNRFWNQGSSRSKAKRYHLFDPARK